MALAWLNRLTRQIHFKNNFLDFNLHFLFLVGLWPMEHLSQMKTFMYKFYEFSLHILSIIFLIISSIGTYQNKDETTLFLSNLDKIFVAYDFCLKVFVLLWKRNQLRVLIDKISESGDIISEKRKRLMSTHVILVSVVSTGILAAFSALAQYKHEMVAEAWMPFDPMQSKMHTTIASQITALTFLPCLGRSLAMQGIVCTLIMYICDQLIDLQNKLKNLKYLPETEMDMRNQLKDIVKKHIRIMEYSKEMDKIFKGYFLVQNLAVTMELCLNAKMVTVVGLNEKNLLTTFLAFLGIAVTNAYIYCYLGNEMIIQSQAIALTAYETSWPSWPVALQKDLLVVIRAAQKPLKLSAGGMAPMSLQTFCQSLYNAYSVFAVLNDVVD